MIKIKGKDKEPLPRKASRGRKTMPATKRKPPAPPKRAKADGRLSMVVRASAELFDRLDAEQKRRKFRSRNELILSLLNEGLPGAPFTDVR